MKKNMIHAFLMLLIAVFPLYGVEARKLAKSLDLPGKFESGKCLPFAKALQARLQAEGVESQIIIYSWTVLTPNQGLLEGKHAFVAFRDERGRWWGIDNFRWVPVQLNPKQLTVSFDWNAVP